jgi:hypothetical protein
MMFFMDCVTADKRMAADGVFRAFKDRFAAQTLFLQS